MSQSTTAFPVANGPVPKVAQAVAGLQVGADGIARSTPIPGTDKTVYPGLTNSSGAAGGSVIFAKPPTAGLTTTAIAALTTTQIGALTSNVVLADAMGASLTTTQIGALTAAATFYDGALSSLTTTQLNALSTSTIATLTTTQIATLAATQIVGALPASGYGAVHFDLPISSMLVVAPASGQTIAVTTRKANGADT